VLSNVETIAAYTPPPLLPWVDWQGGETAQPVRVPKIENSASPTTETKFITPAPDPEKQYVAQHTARHDAYRQLYTEIKIRIRELLREALLANEPFSHDSLSDLLLFMSQISFGRRPAIYLLDNGNFRAVWRNVENEQAALQFRGDDIVHCVFFLKRKAPRLPLNQETLIDVIPKVRARLIAFERLLKG
jgi:hypothetical protein